MVACHRLAGAFCLLRLYVYVYSMWQINSEIESFLLNLTVTLTHDLGFLTGGLNNMHYCIMG